MCEAPERGSFVPGLTRTKDWGPRTCVAPRGRRQFIPIPLSSSAAHPRVREPHSGISAPAVSAHGLRRTPPDLEDDNAPTTFSGVHRELTDRHNKVSGPSSCRGTARRLLQRHVIHSHQFTLTRNHGEVCLITVMRRTSEPQHKRGRLPFETDDIASGAPPTHMRTLASVSTSDRRVVPPPDNQTRSSPSGDASWSERRGRKRN